MVNHELNEPCARPRKKLGFRILLEFFFMFKMLASCLIIFTICIGIDWCRKQMFELVEINRTVRLISKKIESVIKHAVVTFASS